MSERNERRLKAQLSPRTDPKPDPRPPKASVENLTRKEKRWMIRNGMKTAEGSAWLQEVGLIA